MAMSSAISASVTAKVDRRVLPLLLAGWFIAYIDRFNVSFAALQMNRDLQLGAATFGFGAGLFFLGYSVFEIPSNMILLRVGTRRWLSRIMVSWGLICMAMALTRGSTSFHVLRFLLGVAEAGCFPAMAICLAQWLPPRERTAALGKLGSMALISGILGAPLAAGLLALDGVWNLAGWQWLFLLEGAPAVVIGMLVLMHLPERPEEAMWLTTEERDWIRDRLAHETAPAPFARNTVIAVITDWRYWIWGLMFFCLYSSGSALRLWQPLLLRNIGGQSDTMATLLPILSSSVGAVAIVLAGRHSTHKDERRWHITMPMVIAGVGAALLGMANGVLGLLAAAALMSIGNAAQPPLIATVSAASTRNVNAIGIAFVNSLGGLGGFVGPSLWGYVLETTGSLTVGALLSAALVVLAAPLALITRERIAEVSQRHVTA
jgi:ACS family tartrate transporter-like MFS transporter